MSLRGIDRDVYQIVRKFEDELENGGAKNKTLTVPGVYDSIKRSNSSLARQKKRPLEDAIERILRLRKKECTTEDEEAAIDQPEEPNSPKSKERDYFLLNKQITKSWNVPRRQREATPDTATTPGADVSGMDSNAPLERKPNGEPKPKRRKAEHKEERLPPTDISLEDIGGMDDAIETLNKQIILPLCEPEACANGDLNPPRGVLLHGPPGCGKTMLAKAFSAEAGVAYIPVSAPALVAGMSGESEKKIRELYDEAKKLAPCLIFIDEIDVIMGKRDNAQREMEKRIVAQMLTCMDEMSPAKMGGNLVVTLAATNRPDSIDPALRRAGRFNTEISIGIPNEKAREEILRRKLDRLKTSDDVDYKLLAKRTPGFVGADLEDVVSVAQNDMLGKLLHAKTSELVTEDMEIDSEKTISEPVRKLRAMRAAPKNSLPKEGYKLTMQFLLDALGKVQPSSKREGFSTIPDTTWAHIGSLEDVREQLMLSIVRPLQHPERYERLGLFGAENVLLWGPPGCGKTLLAKAVANESQANYISVKGPELLNKYVGESERAIRQVFSRAHASAPCIIFFDELDALVPRRDNATGSDASARVVNQLLTELDGTGGRAGVFVVAATNRPDIIDPAILRPGRIGNNIFVDLPSPAGRADILRTRIRRTLPGGVYAHLAALDAVARDPRADGFSGADLEHLHVAAAKACLRRAERAGLDEVELLPEDWEVALDTVKPSISDSHSKKFTELKEFGWE
ncbi:putative AAA family ATPase/60S ribosome export protein Rix7 [Xylariomycetidae sp. FL0641]|nr:putative AAA family ATPase/60S ribosome export protein Rix7 [Xylariomycetidae sp. FL0641]